MPNRTCRRRARWVAAPTCPRRRPTVGRLRRHPLRRHANHSPRYPPAVPVQASSPSRPVNRPAARVDAPAGAVGLPTAGSRLGARPLGWTGAPRPPTAGRNVPAPAPQANPARAGRARARSTSSRRNPHLPRSGTADLQWPRRRGDRLDHRVRDRLPRLQRPQQRPVLARARDLRASTRGRYAVGGAFPYASCLILLSGFTGFGASPRLPPTGRARHKPRPVASWSTRKAA